jgi:hypothetical protein
MTSIVVPISEEKLEELKKRASKYDIEPERLIEAVVDEMLTRHDEKFNRALEYVLKKNADLYKRLA